MEHVSSTTAEALLNLVKVVFDRFDLELKNLWGQFYDGASNMSGQFNGLQLKIREINSSALYVHCYAHSLNLVLAFLKTRQAEISFRLLKHKQYTEPFKWIGNYKITVKSALSRKRGNVRQIGELKIPKRVVLT